MTADKLLAEAREKGDAAYARRLLSRGAAGREAITRALLEAKVEALEWVQDEVIDADDDMSYDALTEQAVAYREAAGEEQH